MPHACGRRILLDVWKKSSPCNVAFLRALLCCSNLAYRERLVNLGLDRLEVRRLRFDLIYVYKIFFGIDEIDASTFFRVCNASTATRGHSFKLFVPHSRLDVRKYFFCHRVVRCWNSLPAQPDDFSSLNNLKRLLEQTDLSSFLLCRDWLCFKIGLKFLVH